MEERRALDSFVNLHSLEEIIISSNDDGGHFDDNDNVNDNRHKSDNDDNDNDVDNDEKCVP